MGRLRRTTVTNTSKRFGRIPRCIKRRVHGEIEKNDCDEYKQTVWKDTTIYQRHSRRHDRTKRCHHPTLYITGALARSFGEEACLSLWHLTRVRVSMKLRTFQKIWACHLHFQ